MRNKLPGGWRILKVKDFAEVITGGTPSTIKKEYWEGGAVPWLPSGDLKNTKICEAHTFITRLGLENSAAKLMPKKTVLIALTGATTGQTGILEFEACANQSVTGILPSKEHVPEYLFYYMRTAREKILNESYGAAQPHISQGYIKDFEVILPPLLTQQKIVAILEKAEKAKELRKEADELTKDFLKAVFMEMFGDIAKNKKNFEICDFTELIDFQEGPGIMAVDFKNEGIPLIRLRNIKQSTVDLTDCNFLSEDKVKTKWKQFKTREGDILISTSASMGEISEITKDTSGSIPYTGIIRLRPRKNNIGRIYLKYFITSNYYTGQINALQTGGTIKHYGPSHLKQIKMVVPPIELQNKFASIVKEVESMKDQQKHSKDQIDNLFNVLMQRAFKGELIL